MSVSRCFVAHMIGVSPYAMLPPDDRPLAILKSSCGCIDCDISGSSAWHAESGSVSILEEVWGEHEVYGVAWLADGGAVLLSTQRGRSDPEQTEAQSRPSPGAFFHVDAAGAVQTIGPLPGVQGILHSPIALPAR